jgi:hypothetical protein
VTLPYGVTSPELRPVRSEVTPFHLLTWLQIRTATSTQSIKQSQVIFTVSVQVFQRKSTCLSRYTRYSIQEFKPFPKACRECATKPGILHVSSKPTLSECISAPLQPKIIYTVPSLIYTTKKHNQFHKTNHPLPSKSNDGPAAILYKDWKQFLHVLR